MNAAKTIQRLLTMFGEPKTDSPEMYLEEFAKAISGFPDSVLDKACDMAIQECTFFPRPAEIIQRAYRVNQYTLSNVGGSTPDHFVPDPVIEKDEASKERVREMMAVFRQTVAARSLEDAIRPQRQLTRKELASGERDA